MAQATTIAVIAVRIAEFVGFAELAATKPFEERFNLIGSIHDRLAREVDSAGGSLGRNSGESLMATFGATTPTGGDAWRALRCSCAMVQAADEFNAIELNGNGSSIRVTIGVHYGSVPLGNIGCERRLDVAVAGEVRNVASRLEEIAKLLNSNLVASHEVMLKAHIEMAGKENLVPILCARTRLEFLGLAEHETIWTL